MVTLTMVGASRAREGDSFVFLGPVMECGSCPYGSICLSLDVGSEYYVKKARRTSHPCDAIEGGEAVVVEVEKRERAAAVDSKLAMAGSMITFSPAGCGEVGCPSYGICNPPGLDSGTKVSIEAVGGRLECPAGMVRTAITVIRFSPASPGAAPCTSPMSPRAVT